MYYAMAFFPSFENQYCVRSLKLKGYKTAQVAQRAIENRKVEGYVRKLGQQTPIWSNVNP